MEQAHALDWATEQFGGAPLGDHRRVKRLIRYAAAILIKPSASIPAQCEAKKDFSTAVNRMFRGDKVTFQSVSADPRRQTIERVFVSVVDRGVSQVPQERLRGGESATARR